MMFKNVIIPTIFVLLFATNIMAQDPLSPTDSLNTILSDSLVTQMYVSGRGINVSWYPTQPEVWKAQLQKGYTVSRVEVDTAGNVLGAVIPIGENPILPKDSAWMAANKRIADGLLEPIMALMYDSTFMFPENDFLDEAEMKFNYIVYETTNEFEIASAVGMGIIDSTAEEGKTYRYLIKTVNSDLNVEGQADITLVQGRFVRNPKNDPIEFTFPNDLALSDMLAAARPKEAKMIHAIGKSYGDSIVIRWGPSTPRLWQMAMEDGYEVYRHRPGEPSELIKTVYPWRKSEVTEAIAYDSIALMAAGILYNEEEANPEAEEAGLYDKASEFENDFGFSLYAAERSGLAADILGLRFVDKDVERDSSYTYLIGTKGVNSPIFWGKVDLINTFQQAPKPFGFRTESQEKVIKLVWDKPENERRFSGYFLERSTDGINFQKINHSPIVFSENDRFPLQQFSYLDTVGVNDVEFYYKLTGQNSFGEMSEAAPTSGKAKDFTPPYAVQITEAIFNDTLKEFTIRWQAPDIQPADFDNYQIMMSDYPNGFYSSVSEPIAVDQSEFVFQVGEMDIDRGFYFKVQSQDTLGNINTSMNKNCNVPDLIPPDPPAVLTGIIDSTGLVKVAWEHSTAKDLAGYWLYWGNDPKQEMSLVNDDILIINSHSWYVDDVSLNEKIYFCVRPEDDAYNKGDASEIIEVSRPDKVPPTTPFVLAANAADGQIKVTWQLSLSEDVMGQILYKRPVSRTDTLWQMVDTLVAVQNHFLDKNILIDQPYQYCIKNFDDAENISDYSNKKTGKVPFPFEKVIINNLNAKLSKGKETKSNSLTWEYTPVNEQIANVPYTFEIYRAIGGENPKFLETITADKLNFEDTQVVDGVLYNYGIKVKFENGWIGAMSEIKSVLVR